MITSINFTSKNIFLSSEGYQTRKNDFRTQLSTRTQKLIVPDPGKGVCADPVERVAILEVKGPGPPGGVSERQLSPDRGGEKT